MPIKLESKEQYKYDDKYSQFLGYVLGNGKLGEDYAQSFVREVDTLQEKAFQLRNNFSEIEAIKETHENHKAAFEHLTHAYQYQLDRLEELTQQIVTKAPLIDATKKVQLQQQIERAEIFSALQKAHFDLETEYAALKDQIVQAKNDKNNKEQQKAYEAEFSQKEPVVKQLRKIMSELNDKFKNFEKANDKNIKKISEELDALVNQYNQQKNKYDNLAQQVVKTSDSPKAVEKEVEHKKDKKDKKDKQDKKVKRDKDQKDSSKKDNKLLSAVKKAGSTILAAPETAVSAVKKAGSTVIVKPGQHLVRSFSAILVQNDQPLDRNMSVSEPNRTKEYDQILLNEKSPLDAKYKKALEDKIKELEIPNDVFTKEEKALAAKLLIATRNFLAKINSHKKTNSIEVAIKTEKELFLNDLRALLFPQLRANNHQVLKLQIEDLKTQKRLINKMTSKKDELSKNKYFQVIDECISVIKKARKKIKETKSYDEMMQYMLPLAAYNEKCKAAKGEFNKYLTENTAAKLVDRQASPDITSESGSPTSGSALSARSSIGDFSDERTGDSETLTGSAISSISTRPPSPTTSHSDFSTPRSSVDNADEGNSEVINDEIEVEKSAKLAQIEAETNAKLAELDVENLALKQKEAEVLNQIKQLKEIERLEKELYLLNEKRKQQIFENVALIKSSEERSAQLEKNIEERRKREESEIANRKAQLEKEIQANAKAQEELKKEFDKIAKEKSEIAKELSEIAAERKAAELEAQRISAELEKLARERKQAEERIAVEEKQKADQAQQAKELEEKRAREEQAQRDAEEKTRKERLERWGVSQASESNNPSLTTKADHTSRNMPANDMAPRVEPVIRGANSNQVKSSSKQPFLVGKEQIEFNVEKMKIARDQIQAFRAKLLIEDEAQKKSWWPFYFKDTKLTKRAELQKLCDVIKVENDDNVWDFYEAVKKARKDGGTLTQSIKSDRTRTLLDNILDGHPEYGTDHPTKEQRAERKARIAELKKSSPSKRR